MPFLASLGPLFAGGGGAGAGLGIGKLAAGLLTGGSALFGGLANRGKTIKSKGTQRSTRILSPEQQQLLTAISGTLNTRLANPEAGIAPLRTSARNRINATATAAGDTLETNLVRRGFGRSGKLQRGLRDIESSRVGAFGDLEGKLAEFVLRREDDTLGLVERLLSIPFGEESTTSSEQRVPGNVAAGAVGGGLQTLTSLLTLDRLLKNPSFSVS